VFQQWGGGQLADQVESGRVLDISSATKSWIGTVGGAATNWQVKGKQYGVPYSLGLVGFWYNKDFFSRAGISGPPATWEEFLADVQKLKAAGFAPIALGGKDRWPDAFYWDYLALRMCSKKTLQQAAVDYKFTDSCWTQAGVKTKQLLDANPFQNGFLATPAQQGAGSSAGLLANGKAAMELQGHWNPGTMNPLTPDGKGLGDKLGWFAFPNVSGGSGESGALLGGGDGFSCSYKAPLQACADFLKFLSSTDVQKRWAALSVGLPVTQGSESGVVDTNLRSLVDARAKASYVQTYLDIAFTTSVGQALDDAIANQFAGTLTPEQVVKALSDAAKNR
jgi:raffinose/stachyose/melibiose transport system substrate-binding protein